MNFFRLSFLHTFHLLTNSHFGMVFKHFKIFLTLKIQQMVSFNSNSCVPMWPSTSSLGLWLEFLELVSFWFKPNFLVANI